MPLLREPNTELSISLSIPLCAQWHFNVFLEIARNQHIPRERFAICLANAFCCSVLFSFYVHKIALGNVSLRSVQNEFKNARDWTVIIVLGVFQVFFRNLLPRPQGGFNKRKTLCSGQTAHMKCIRKWIRTLIPSSTRCKSVECRWDILFAPLAIKLQLTPSHKKKNKIVMCHYFPEDRLTRIQKVDLVSNFRK